MSDARDEYDLAPDDEEQRAAPPTRSALGPGVSRAQVLMQQGRYADAEKHLRQELAADPTPMFPHALLALCLASQGKRDAALVEARLARNAEPGAAFAHFVLGHVRLVRDEHAEAERAAREALRLEVGADAHWRLLAQALAGQSRWQDALDAVDRALALDADDADSRNVRAMLLTQLGRRAEAARTIEGALRRDPDNAQSHANLGWTLLHLSRPREALERFREALRLDPSDDWAKAGLVEALKARNPVYRALLAYLLWMGRLSERAQWAMVIGAFVGSRVLRTVARENPGVAPFIYPISALYLLFVVLTWLGPSLFDLSLRFNKWGWWALTSDQRRGANLLGTALAVALAAGVAAVVTRDPVWLTTVLLTVGVMLPASTVFRVARGWPRAGVALFTAFMAALAGVIVWSLLAGGSLDGDAPDRVASTALTTFGACALVAWLGLNVLVAKYPARARG